MINRPHFSAVLALFVYTALPHNDLPAAAASDVTSASAGVLEARAAAIAPDFPDFIIPGHTSETVALRDLFWHHDEKLGPMATLWDEWLLTPSIWPYSLKVIPKWRAALLTRDIDPDGYVATHQHQSIAHQHGWPFPAWHQGGGFGWHFSFENTIFPPWRPDNISAPEDWITTGIKSDGVQKSGWAMELTSAGATIQPPAVTRETRQSPFLQLRWSADWLPDTARPFVEWKCEGDSDFSRDQRMYFDPAPPGKISYTMIPLYRHHGWNNRNVTGLRINFDNQTTGARVVVQALFSTYDTRHDVNNPSYVSACIDYFHWTGDLNFLRKNVERMRLAMRFMETEFGTDKDGIVKVPWVGHEGTSGVVRGADGRPHARTGLGVGNNYWDLLPFGQQDSYATIRHYGAALKMASLEEEIEQHPQWNIAPSPLLRDPQHWRDQATMARENGNRLFWNSATGRFTLGIDSEGKQADFGYTFLNLEAIAYDFATPDHARKILDWIEGRRSVADDTSTGTDIYHWRFAPRASTRRNISHYGWVWSDPDAIPFGNQVQDGGAVLGFSYHDIMARLKVNGPDDAAQRLQEIARWYRIVADAGGYRSYYDGKTHPGTLQGAGTAGGLGLDKEFFESVMVPQVLLDGFMGLQPTGEGFALRPQLPKGWPSLTITNINVKGLEMNVAVTSRTMIISGEDDPPVNLGMVVTVPAGWEVISGGRALGPAGGDVRVAWQPTKARELRLERSGR